MTAPLFLAQIAIALGGPPPMPPQDHRRDDWQVFTSQVAIAITGAPQPQVPPPRDSRRGDWQQAYDGRRDGRLLPLRELERRVVPQMGGAQYLGVEMDSAPIYTFKFIRDGAVIWVDVDGRSGQIIRRTGR